jgi:hypothetical protein
VFPITIIATMNNEIALTLQSREKLECFMEGQVCCVGKVGEGASNVTLTTHENYCMSTGEYISKYSD